VYTNNLPINKWAEEDRPREKLILKGRSSLTNAEILAIIIGSGSRTMTAVDLSKHILGEYNNDLHELGKSSVKNLKQFNGIGEAKAISIVAALELGRRRQLTNIVDKPKVASSKDAYECIQGTMADLDHEVFKIILLNRANRVLKIEVISVGGVSGTVVDPKVIFKKALAVQASSIILAHNHPSGNLRPSQADLSVTKRLVKAGESLDIKVIDHLIVAEGGFYSFADEGKM
jgi:DNA repair protein RadC